ncbi:MAG: response regulator transcription factor [Clostridia bacterium]|nr:response regulator transcription factor [Clostridia bacterium]
MKLNIAICDDEQIQIDNLNKMVSEWAMSEGVSVNLKSFHSAESFMFEYSENKSFDILLLDIEMSGMNGIELAKKIRQDNGRAAIIFITGYPDFISEGYDVSALHYLMKPVKFEKLTEVLKRSVSNMEAEPPSLVIEGKELLRVFFKDIIYAESDGHYVVLKTVKGEHRIRMTIPEIAEKLTEGFFRCHRSYVVGLKYVQKITKASVFLSNGTELPLGKGQYDEMNRQLIGYLRGL